MGSELNWKKNNSFSKCIYKQFDGIRTSAYKIWLHIGRQNNFNKASDLLNELAYLGNKMAHTIKYKVTTFIFCSIFVLLYMIDDMINITDKISYNY